MAEAAPRSPLALIAHHQEWAARSLESILGPTGYTVLRANDDRLVVEQAQYARPDVYILDATLPDGGGLELCRRLREEGYASPTTPILLTVAGPTTRGARLEGLRVGAWDVLGLPLDAEELVLKVRTYVGAKVEADLTRDEGLLDQITGLYNVRGLLRRARELGAEASRHQRALACIVLAPEAGRPPPEPHTPEHLPPTDTIVQMADALRSGARGSDAIGRLGRSEFVVLAPDTDGSGARVLAERLSREVATPALAVRAGYYAVTDFHAAAIEPVELLVRATQALRSAQPPTREGRVRSYDAEPPTLS
jgi:PleD family two-component response regulator